jgi:electron-transferring-flavoprotein dehydrogenase
MHTAGWPLATDTYGGSFPLPPGQQPGRPSASSSAWTTPNPWLSPFEEFQRWKTHPEIKALLEGGRRLGYGARSITAGGLLSLPKTVFRAERWSAARPAT